MLKRRALTPEQKHRRKLAVRRWQAKQKAAGRCVTCGAPRKKKNKWHCARHAAQSARIRRELRLRNLEKDRERMRARAANRRKKWKAERAAAGRPVRKWGRRRPPRSGN